MPWRYIRCLHAYDDDEPHNLQSLEQRPRRDVHKMLIKIHWPLDRWGDNPTYIRRRKDPCSHSHVIIFTQVHSHTGVLVSGAQSSQTINIQAYRLYTRMYIHRHTQYQYFEAYFKFHETYITTQTTNINDDVDDDHDYTEPRVALLDNRTWIRHTKLLAGRPNMGGLILDDFYSESSV